jgi:O-antigen ligase
MPLKLSSTLRAAARGAFALTLFLLPLRARLTLLARPVPPVYGDYTDFLLYASDLALLGLLALWAARLLLERRLPRRGPFIITAPLVGLSFAGLASVLTSVDPALSLYHCLRLAALFGLYLYVVNEVRSLTELILPLGAQVAAQSALASAQYWTQRSLGLARLGELSLDPAVSGVSIVWANGVRALRAYGLADHPNLLGGCLAFALILLGAWYAASSVKWRWAAGAAFVLGSAGLLYTFSRAAELALSLAIVVSLFWLYLTRQRRLVVEWARLLGAAALVVLPLAAQNAPFISTRLNVDNSFQQVATENRSLAERQALTQAVNQVLANHVLSGVGLGALPLALRQAAPDFPFYYQPAHNTLLDAAAETGAFGALFYLALLSGPWLGMWLQRRRMRFSPELIGASALLLALTLVGMFDYYPWLLAPGRLWQWTAWGLWAVFYQRDRDILHA